MSGWDIVPELKQFPGFLRFQEGENILEIFKDTEIRTVKLLNSNSSLSKINLQCILKTKPLTFFELDCQNGFALALNLLWILKTFIAIILSLQSDAYSK